MDNNCQQDTDDKDNEKKSDNNICQRMYLDILCRIKYEFSLEHKVIYNSTMSYFIILMIISLEVLKNVENK